MGAGGETSATGMFGQSDTAEETLPALSQQELLVSDWEKNDPDADDAPVSPLSTDVDGPMVKPTHTLKLGVQFKLKGHTTQKGNKRASQ